MSQNNTRPVNSLEQQMWDFYSGGPNDFQGYSKDFLRCLKWACPYLSSKIHIANLKNIVSLKIRGLRKAYCPLRGIFFSWIGLSFNIFQKFAIKTVIAQIHWLGMISYTCQIKVLNQKAWNWGLTGWQYINHDPFPIKCKTTVKTLPFCQLNPALPRH